MYDCPTFLCLLQLTPLAVPQNMHVVMVGVSHGGGAVMVTMIVEIIVMKLIALVATVPLLSGHVPTTWSVSPKDRGVMEHLTVQTVLMSKAVVCLHLISVSFFCFLT